MNMHTFSIGEAVQFGWDTMKANLGFFIGALIIAFLIELAPEIIGDVLKEDAPIAAAVAYVISVIVQMVITMGFIKISLRLCDNDKPDLSDLFTCFPLFFKYLAGSILYVLIILGGLILLIVPGIIWAIKFQFFSYFIIDRELGPIEALKRSSEITNGVKMDLFLFGLLLAGINLLGALCCLIGLFATIPTTMVALAFVYRTLQRQVGAPPLPSTSPDGWPTS